jgi:hypothetical protein
MPLGEVVFRIVNISKVRIGNEQARTFIDYDEISLNDIDEYGYIRVTPGQKNLGPANPTSIKSQSLNYGDIVFTHRGNVFKVGMVGESYERTIVGNNSMIRIQTVDPKPLKRSEKVKPDINLSRYIQAYLQLPLVKEYLGSLIICGSPKERRILNAAILSKLPIPISNLGHGEFGFAKIIETRMELILKAQTLLEQMHRVLGVCEQRKEDVVKLLCNDAADTHLKNDVEYMRVLGEIERLVKGIR